MTNLPLGKPTMPPSLIVPERTPLPTPIVLCCFNPFLKG